MESFVLANVSNSVIAFSFVFAMFSTIVFIPPLMRLVNILGLADLPGSRKIHDHPIPRVGGIAIAIGVLLPTLIWVPYDLLLFGCLLGALVILIGGIWDDCKALSQKAKVLFQLVAIAVTLQSGLLIEHVPFFGLDAAPLWVSYPLTIIFLLGATNATNLFDGLDGLAGGCVLLSLVMIAIFSYSDSGNVITLISLTIIGATLGFLRFNNHPASVFMGDAGSQLLGFTAAVLSILLIESTHAGLNFGLPLLILGLPILDTAMVMVLRMRSGISPFSPDNRHIHHQFLKLGFNHANAVAILYVIQSGMVTAAYVLRFQSDLLVVSAFFVLSALVLGTLYVLRARGDRTNGRPIFPKEQTGARWERLNRSAAYVRPVLEYSLAASFLVVGLFLGGITTDTAIFILALSAVSLLTLFFMRPWAVILSRLSVYTVALLASFLCFSEVEAVPAVDFYLKVFLACLVFGVLYLILFDKEKAFQFTPLDLLICILAISVPIFYGKLGLDFPITKHLLGAGIMIYASECIISAAPQRHRVLKSSALVSLILLGAKALI